MRITLPSETAIASIPASCSTARATRRLAANGSDRNLWLPASDRPLRSRKQPLDGAPVADPPGTDQFVLNRLMYRWQRKARDSGNLARRIGIVLNCSRDRYYSTLKREGFWAGHRCGIWPHDSTCAPGRVCTDDLPAHEARNFCVLSMPGC